MGPCTWGNVLPFAAMVVVQFTDIGAAPISKAAMSKGMSSYVLVVYSSALGTIFLLPCFNLQKKISLTFSLLGGQFLLGLIGSSSLLLSYNGNNYGSPTLASAMGNLIPIYTFILAIIFSQIGSLHGGLTLAMGCLLTATAFFSVIGSIIIAIGFYICYDVGTNQRKQHYSYGE